MISPKLESLSRVLATRGFDICARFPIQLYNAHCKEHLKISAFGKETNLAVLIGASKQFWYPFVEWLKTREAIPKDPIDTYTQTTIQAIVHDIFGDGEFSVEIRFDCYDLRSGKFVHLQTAAHCSGAGFFDIDTMWNVHPTFGLWHMLKAVLIFDIDFSGPAPVLQPNNLLTSSVKENMQALTAVATSENWRNISTRLAIRDACDRGREWRYDQDMLDYFYPIHRSSAQVIKDIFEQKTEQ